MQTAEMSKILPIRTSDSAGDTLTPAGTAVVEAVNALLKPLSPIEQEAVLTHLKQLIPSNATPRAGKVLGAVVRHLEHERTRRREWTVREIKDAVAGQGVRAKPREVFNAIAYLARRGRVVQVAYGRYRLLDYGVGIETADDLGVEGRSGD